MALWGKGKGASPWDLLGAVSKGIPLKGKGKGKGLELIAKGMEILLAKGKGLGLVKGKGADMGKGKGKSSPGKRGPSFAFGESQEAVMAPRQKKSVNVQTRIQAGETLYRGRVRQYNQFRNRGYIASDEVMRESGQEVYVWKDVLAGCNASVGDYVLFFVHWSARGQPQASGPMLRLSGGGKSMAHKGIFRLSEEAGAFGVIECQEFKDFFARDVVIGKELGASLSPGSLVSFNCFVDESGIPVVEAVTPCDESWAPNPSDLSWSHELEDPQDPNSNVIAMGRDLQSTNNQNSALTAVPTGQIYTGIVKSFNTANQYGFIECKETHDLYKQDVFLHGNALTDTVGMGDIIVFELAINKRGQPQAQNVSKGDLGEPAPKRQKVGGTQAASDAFDQMVAELTK